MKKTVFFCALLINAAALADVSMDYTDGAFVRISGAYASVGSDDGYVIFEKGKDTFVMVNPAERTYMEVSQDFGKQVRSAIDTQMQEMLAQMPPEQREMVKKQMQGMLGGGMDMEPPQMRVERTGKTDKVAGFNCAEARVSYGPMHEEMACIATMDELGLKKSDFEVLVSAIKSMTEMTGMKNKDKSAMDFDVMGGVPIRTVDRRHGSDSELKALSRDKIDASSFSVPQGYRKVSVEDMMGR